MDIVSIQQQLASAGFPVAIGDIEALIAEFNQAVQEGKIKQSLAPDREKYSIAQVILFVTGKEVLTNSMQLWRKAVKYIPDLETLKFKASYSKTGTVREGQGVTSTNLKGVVYLAAFFRFEPNKEAFESLEDSRPLDPRIPTTSGYVYLMRDTGNNCLKLGYTADIGTRISQHRTSNPFLALVVIFPVNSQRCESIAHQLLRDYRIVGTQEWYTDCPRVLEILFDCFVS